MECEQCGREAFCTAVITDGLETVPVHLCEKCSRVAGIAAHFAGAWVVGVYKPGEVKDDAARPSTRPA